MDVDKGDIVISLAGRDKDRLFFVTAAEGDFVYLADGRLRRVEAVKKKRRKHVACISSMESCIALKLRNGEKVLNSELRKALSSFTREADREAAVSGKGR